MGNQPPRSAKAPSNAVKCDYRRRSRGSCPEVPVDSSKALPDRSAPAMRARVEVLATRASNQLRAKQRRLGRLRSADELAAHAADWRFLRTSPPAAHRLVTDGPAGRSARHLLRRVEAWTPGAPRRSVGAWGGMPPTRYGRLGSERRVGALAIRAPCRGARDARRTSSERSNGACMSGRDRLGRPPNRGFGDVPNPRAGRMSPETTLRAKK